MVVVDIVCGARGRFLVVNVILIAQEKFKKDEHAAKFVSHSQVKKELSYSVLDTWADKNAKILYDRIWKLLAVLKQGGAKLEISTLAVATIKEKTVVETRSSRISRRKGSNNTTSFAAVEDIKKPPYRSILFRIL